VTADVFISHSSRNDSVARRLERELERRHRPTDPSALNGLGSILMVRELDAAAFFVRAAIAAARKRGMAGYPAAEHDLALIERFRAN
jgi:hypothetical protein